MLLHPCSLGLLHRIVDLLVVTKRPSFGTVGVYFGHHAAAAALGPAAQGAVESSGRGGGLHSTTYEMLVYDPTISRTPIPHGTSRVWGPN